MDLPNHHSFWPLVGRYLAVGGLTVLCYFAVLAITFSVLHAPYPIAVGIAYGLALAVHFFANRSFTFLATRASPAVQAGRYAATCVINYLIQLAVVFLAYDIAGLNFFFAASLGVLATLLSGFVLMTRWVFKRGPGNDIPVE